MSIARLGAALALGGGLAYYLDSRSGRRRRAQLRDKALHDVRLAITSLDVALRDLLHRSHGILVETRALAVAEPEGAAKIREKLERRLHPRSASVRAHAPQGRAWRPATRLVASAGALALVSWGRARRGLFGPFAVAAGGVLLVRALTNYDVASLVGANPEAHIAVEKTITIHAPVREVFERWVAYEELPRVFRRLSEVRRVGVDRSHWRVRGPLNVPFEWDAIAVETVPDELVRFTSVESAPVRIQGSVRFEALPDNATRLTIRMSYEPPLGAIGHALAKLFAVDPKRVLDDDLLRFKAMLEQKPPRNIAAPEGNAANVDTLLGA